MEQLVDLLKSQNRNMRFEINHSSDDYNTERVENKFAFLCLKGHGKKKMGIESLFGKQ